MSNNKYNKVDRQIMLVNISSGFIWIHTRMNTDDDIIDSCHSSVFLSSSLKMSSIFV